MKYIRDLAREEYHLEGLKLRQNRNFVAATSLRRCLLLEAIGESERERERGVTRLIEGVRTS